MKLFAVVYLSVVLGLSLVAFVFYGFDKRRARRNGRRVPENTLHLLALFGGWPGALAGQKVFRHKTQKTRFQILFWLCVVIHVGVGVSTAYLLRSR